MSPGIDSSVLGLASNNECRQRLAAWADTALRAHALELEVRTVCNPVELDIFDSVEQITALASSLDVLEVPADELPNVREEANTNGTGHGPEN